MAALALCNASMCSKIALASWRRAPQSEGAQTLCQAGPTGLDWYTPGSEYVITDTAGIPVRPDEDLRARQR